MPIFWEENFFSPLAFAKWIFFVPRIFFLRIWRQLRPVARTLKSLVTLKHWTVQWCHYVIPQDWQFWILDIKTCKIQTLQKFWNSAYSLHWCINHYCSWTDSIKPSLLHSNQFPCFQRISFSELIYLHCSWCQVPCGGPKTSTRTS